MFDPFKISGDEEIDFEGKNLTDGIPVELLNDCSDDSIMYDDTEVYLKQYD